MADVEIVYSPDQVLTQLIAQKTKVDRFLDVRAHDQKHVFRHKTSHGVAMQNADTLLGLAGDLAEVLLGTDGVQQVQRVQCVLRQQLHGHA